MSDEIPPNFDSPPPAPPKNKGGRPHKPPPPPPPRVVQSHVPAAAPFARSLTNATFAGITPGPNGDCCNDCSVDLCMITMIGFCGHPSKGALQAALQNKPEIVARRRYAKRMLDEMTLDARKD